MSNVAYESRNENDVPGCIFYGAKHTHNICALSTRSFFGRSHVAKRN